MPKDGEVMFNPVPKPNYKKHKRKTTDKSIRAAVFSRATPKGSAVAICEFCGSEMATELHHSIGGNGKRMQHESVESCFALGEKCHKQIESKDGKRIRRQLILTAQRRYFDQGLSEDKVRRMMGGKIYSELEVE
jgi:hypothetical protein